MIKRVYEEPKPKRQFIYMLQTRGKIKRYIVDGYACYDTEEFDNREKGRRGRKPKVIEIN